jgi:hypothetical protein
MPSLTMPPTEGDLLKFDLGQNYTREEVTLLTGTNYAIGSVLGLLTSGANAGKYTLSPNAAADPDVGNQVAAAVLIAPVNATGGDAKGVVIRRGPAIVSKAALVFDASVNDAPKRAAKIAQLVAIGIVARDAA